MYLLYQSYILYIVTFTELKKLNLPQNPGVYLFKKSTAILYIGKATSLKDRVASYFTKDLVQTRSVAIADMVVLADNVDYIETDTVLEALILEAELIKKHKPKYNTKEKDNKSFNYVVITKETMPQVLLLRGRNIKIKRELDVTPIKKIFGPFTSGGAIREGLKIIRRIFPYIDGNSIKKDQYTFYRQLGLTPDVADIKSIKKYNQNIKNIIHFFEGKKKTIITNLEKKMMAYSKKQAFEDALEIKKQLFALTHINDVSLLKSDFNDMPVYDTTIRIEGYDVAHMSGKNMVGVMTVIVNGYVDKAEYKKFLIKTQTHAHDIGSLYEILMRRFRHTEWGIPDVVVVDGGLPQIHIAEQVLQFYQMDIPVVSVLKDEHHKPKDILGKKEIIQKHKKEILLVNNEAHRFSITFHKEKRAKAFIKKQK